MFRTFGATLAAGLSAVVVTLSLSVGAQAAGAIAFNPYTLAWGWAAGYSLHSVAKSQANANCKYNCNNWVTFNQGQCAAAAADWTRYGGGYTGTYGWGRSSSKAGARNRALSECRNHGGRDCRILVWSCD